LALLILWFGEREKKDALTFVLVFSGMLGLKECANAGCDYMG
jgi:hypothetical protein